MHCYPQNRRILQHVQWECLILGLIAERVALHCITGRHHQSNTNGFFELPTKAPKLLLFASTNHNLTVPLTTGTTPHGNFFCAEGSLLLGLASSLLAWRAGRYCEAATLKLVSNFTASLLRSLPSLPGTRFGRCSSLLHSGSPKLEPESSMGTREQYGQQKCDEVTTDGHAFATSRIQGLPSSLRGLSETKRDLDCCHLVGKDLGLPISLTPPFLETMLGKQA